MQHFVNLLFVSAIVFCLQLSAAAQVRIGAKAGLNLANISYSDDYLIDLSSISEGRFSKGILPAFHIGSLVEFDLGSSVGLSAGFQLSIKGGSREVEGNLLGEDVTITRQTRPVYVQIPLAFYYRHKGFYAGAGPYAGLGVAGKVRTKSGRDGQTTAKGSENIVFSREGSLSYHDGGASFSPLDYGVGVELGYEFNPFRLSVSYQHGLANVLPQNAVDQGQAIGRDYKMSHRVLGVSATYLFDL